MSGLQLDLNIMVATDNLDGVGSSGAGVQGQFYFAERSHANIMQQLELIYALKIPFRADFYFCHIPFYIIMRKIDASQNKIVFHVSVSYLNDGLPASVYQIWRKYREDEARIESQDWNKDDE